MRKKTTSNAWKSVKRRQALPSRSSALRKPGWPARRMPSRRDASRWNRPSTAYRLIIPTPQPQIMEPSTASRRKRASTENPFPASQPAASATSPLEGNAAREENLVLLPTGEWRKTGGASYSYDLLNRRVETVRDNGRTSSRALTCTGEPLWEVDEDGVRTDYAYNTARQLIETTRSEINDGLTSSLRKRSRRMNAMRQGR